MQESEVAELQYLLPSYPNPHLPHLTSTHNNKPPFHFTTSNPFHHLPITPQIQELTAQPTCFSSNSTSDEADQQNLGLINEKKQRRMLSNRESARRSRMRKKKHLDELWLKVLWLQNKNHQLVDKLNRVSEAHDSALKENSQLREETSELRQILTDMQPTSPYHTWSDLDYGSAYFR